MLSSKRRKHHFLTPKGPGQILTSINVLLRPSGNWRKSICISINKSSQAEHNETIPVALSRFSKKLYKPKKASDLHDFKWHWKRSPIQIALDHHDLYDIWSSWCFRMSDDKTAAVSTQLCRWIAILAWHGIEKEVTDYRPWESSALNFEEWYKIV